MSASDETDSSQTDASETFAGPPTPWVWPTVGFTDVDAGIDLLTDGLGFVITEMVRGEDGTVEHAEARWPDGGGVMFGSRDKRGTWGTLGPQGVYVVAADAATVDKAWARVKTRPDVEVLRPLHDADYGSHQFDFRDRDGNLWCLGTYRGA